MISITTCVGTALLIFITNTLIDYLYEFYSNVKLYPSGPFPLPVVGNLLSNALILKRNLHPYIAIHETCRPYGKVCTFWFGSKPIVIINDFTVGKHAFIQANCSGRFENCLVLLVSDTFRGFGFNDYCGSVKFHRKLSSDVIRQLLSSQKLGSLVNNTVIQTVNLIKSRENTNAFSPDLYFPQMSLIILSELMFGQKYSFGDKQLQAIEHSLELFNSEITKLVLIDYLPISRYFIRNSEKIKSDISQLSSLYDSMFEKCKTFHKIEKCDSIASLLLTARTKLRLENSENSNFLTDNDLKGILGTLYSAGADAIVQSLNWMLLLVAHYTEVQQRLRDEINSFIGKNICPDLEDRKKCNYVNAFIHEALRFRTLLPLGAPHSTLCEVIISNHVIPKDTILLLNQYNILNNPMYWKHPEKFLPERFLDLNHLFSGNRFPAYIPFSIGKRMCIGGRLAVDLLFVELVCLLQATDGFQFDLSNCSRNGNLDVNPFATIAIQPKPYKIILQQTGVLE